MDAMRIRIVAGLCLLAALSIGCDRDHDSKQDYADRSLSEPINRFNVEGNDIESASVSSPARGKMLGCELPSTERRLYGESLTTQYKVVTRARETVDTHFMIRDEDKGYSTLTGGSIFKRTYALNRLSVDGSSALGGGAIAYRDTCTSGGCDVKQRQYLAGSAAYLVQVDANLRKILRELDLKPKKNCNFKSTGGQPKELVRQGTYPLGGVAYKAVKFSYVEEGELYCDSSSIGDGTLSGSVYIGKAKRSRQTIVLADTLPQMHNEISPMSVTSDVGPCSRTTVWTSETIESDGRIYKGTSKEIVSASIIGSIRTVEEFKKMRQNQQELLQRLRDAVVLARSEKSDADFQVSDNEVKLKEAQSRLSRANSEASQAEALAGRTGATEADKTSAVLKRAEATAASENVSRMDSILSSKRELASLANKRLQEAQSALSKAEAEERISSN